jgi:hypothetical protein
MTDYQLHPVGWVESPLTDRDAAPCQGDEGRRRRASSCDPRSGRRRRISAWVRRCWC